MNVGFKAVYIKEDESKYIVYAPRGENQETAIKYLEDWMQKKADELQKPIDYYIKQISKGDGEITIAAMTVYPQIKLDEIQHLKLIIEEKNRVIYNLQQTVNELEETLSKKVTLDEVEQQVGAQLSVLHTSLKEKDKYITSLTEENMKLLELLLSRGILWEEK